jgi:hypothetical protein
MTTDFVDGIEKAVCGLGQDTGKGVTDVNPAPCRTGKQ